MSWQGEDTGYSKCGKIDRIIMKSLQKSSRKAAHTQARRDAMESINEEIADLYEKRREIQEILLKTCTHPVKSQFVNRYCGHDTLGHFRDHAEFTYKCSICLSTLHRESR